MTMTTHQADWTLPVKRELRVEVGEADCIITLEHGSAEIFGREMNLNQPYTFNDENIAIFTWYGCQIKIGGRCTHAYIADENVNMVAMMNSHHILEAKRDVARANGTSGPRVSVLNAILCLQPCLLLTVHAQKCIFCRSWLLGRPVAGRPLSPASWLHTPCGSRELPYMLIWMLVKELWEFLVLCLRAFWASSMLKYRCLLKSVAYLLHSNW